MALDVVHDALYPLVDLTYGLTTLAIPGLTGRGIFCTLKNKFTPVGKVATCMASLFTSGEVQKLVGLTQRQLAYWDESALAHPHGRPAEGSGSRRLYTFLDVVQLKLIHRLRQAGITLQKIRQALVNLADLTDEPAPLAELEVVTDGHRIIIRKSNEQLLDPLTHQYFLRLPLAILLAEIENRVISTSPGTSDTTANPAPHVARI